MARLGNPRERPPWWTYHYVGVSWNRGVDSIGAYDRSMSWRQNIIGWASMSDSEQEEYR
jgi:hypothetical protein